MEITTPNRLSTLGHPRRLALFRLLMRRYLDHIPATELAKAFKLKPNMLSNYVSALTQAGLIHQERVGRCLRYAIDMKAAQETLDYLLRDCCRGRPEICAPNFDFVFTVCNQAANAECPLCSGQPINAYWGLPGPVKIDGSDAEKSLVFRQTYGALRNRMIAFLGLPLASLDRLSLQKAVDAIGQSTDKGSQI